MLFFALQLDICSYDQIDLCITQLNDLKLSLVIEYFERAAKLKSTLPSLYKKSEPQLHLEDNILLYYYHGQKLFVQTVTISPLTIFKWSSRDIQNTSTSTSLAIMLVAIYV